MVKARLRVFRGLVTKRLQHSDKSVYIPLFVYTEVSESPSEPSSCPLLEGAEGGLPGHRKCTHHEELAEKGSPRPAPQCMKCSWSIVQAQHRSSESGQRLRKGVKSSLGARPDSKQSETGYTQSRIVSLSSTSPGQVPFSRIRAPSIDRVLFR